MDGTLPITDAAPFKAGGRTQAVLQTEIDVTTAGKVGLRLNDATSLQIFAGNAAVTPAPELTLDLPAGRSTITVVVDAAARNTPLKLSTFRPEGSPAAVRPVGGN